MLGRQCFPSGHGKVLFRRVHLFLSISRPGLIVSENEDQNNIRLRAERRLGEMMEEGKADRVSHGNDRRSKVSEKLLKPKLEDVGIVGNLAHRARTYARLPAGPCSKPPLDTDATRGGLGLVADRNVGLDDDGQLIV
jgi:hypothetical protein